MNRYLKIARTILDGWSPNYGSNGVHSLTEMLYLCFTELNPIKSKETQSLRNASEPYLDKLSEQEIDTVFILINDLCTQYEKTAFMKGMQVGTCLMTELLTHP